MMAKSLWDSGRSGALAASSRSENATRFRNPANGYVETIDKAWLWCLLFGCIYLAYKGAWMAAVLALLLAFLTGGLSWFVYPFFARQLVAKSYMQRGWQLVGGETTDAAPDFTT